jgi:hypothetical protein
MKIKIIVSISVLLIIGFGIWYKLIYSFEPQNIIYHSTNFSIPNDSKLIEFKREKSDFNGDGSLLIIYSLTAKGTKELTPLFETKGNDLLPIKYFSFQLDEQFLNVNDKGYYKFNEIKNSIVILNKSKSLFVYYVVFK